MFIEPQKELTVYGSFDTVVVGGGIAGVAAALAAARGGNKVLLCEREFILGGLGTAGLVTIYLPLCDGKGHQVSFGIAEELLKHCPSVRAGKLGIPRRGWRVAALKKNARPGIRSATTPLCVLFSWKRSCWRPGWSCFTAQLSAIHRLKMTGSPICSLRTRVAEVPSRWAM